MIYCRACGLYMSNGFCPHGNVDLMKLHLYEQLQRQVALNGPRKQGKR